MTMEQTEQRSFSTVELIQGLRDLAQIGIVNARRDTALLNQAADKMEELARYRIEHLPPPTDRDWALLLEECTNRGTRIQALEKEAENLHRLLAQEKAKRPDDYDEKHTSGLLEE